RRRRLMTWNGNDARLTYGRTKAGRRSSMDTIRCARRRHNVLRMERVMTRLRNGLAIALLLGASAALAGQPIVEVYKSATCGCCKEWVRHLRDNGFEVRAHDVPDPAAHRARA